MIKVKIIFILTSSQSKKILTKNLIFVKDFLKNKILSFFQDKVNPGEQNISL